MQVEIEKLTFGGAGMARANGKVVFVKGGLPGDVLKVKITKDKGSYAEASIEEVLRTSPERTQAPCPVFGECGGCQLQHLKYPSQLSAKENILRETLERIGGLRGIEIEPIFPSLEEYSYRNKVTVSTWFQKGRYHLGFHEEGSRKRVPIEGCPIASSIINEAIFRLDKFLSSIDNPRYPLVRIHIASDGKTAHISLVPSSGMGPKRLNGLRHHIKKSLETGSVSVAGYNEEEFEFNQSGLKFYSSPSVFIQSNREINERLVETLVEWSNLKGHERALDLYCGVGNFSLHLAKRAKEVVGVDVSAKAIKLAKKGAEANSITNVIFDCSPSELYVEESLKRGDKFDLVILDPPREGAKEILKALGLISPKKIIYVSCDPPTLARDLKMLTEFGYKLIKIRPFDMFPQTYHIESLALLVRV
ncbi:MAG: 23S rRNA (uracil(1939)-C(5))-methyltransferase RlmD [Thermodesulfobacteriota bacterium]